MRTAALVTIVGHVFAASTLACLTSCEPARVPSTGTVSTDAGIRPASPRELADVSARGEHIEKACGARVPTHKPSTDANAVPFKLVLRDKTSGLFRMKSVCVLLDDHVLIPTGKAGAVVAGLQGGHSVALDTKLMPLTSHLVEMSLTLQGAGTLAGYKFRVTSPHIFGSANGITLEVDLYEADDPHPERRPKVVYREIPQGDVFPDAGRD